MIFRDGTIEYTEDYAKMRSEVWNSEVIGQVKRGFMGEKVQFEGLAEIEVTLTEKASDGSDDCAEREVICLQKATWSIELKDYKEVSYKLPTCDVSKWATLAQQGGLESVASDAAIDIETKYVKEEDKKWLNTIISKVSATTLDIGGTTPFGSTISSANALLMQVIDEVVRQHDTINKGDLAVGVSSTFYSEIKALYPECCQLGVEGMNQEVTGGDLGVYSFYILPDAVVNTNNVHIVVYPWATAIKAIGCDRVGWSEGTGTQAGNIYYNRDTNFGADIKPYDMTNVYGAKYVKTLA